MKAIGRFVDSVSDLIGWSRLALWQRRAVKTIGAITFLIVLSSVLYHYVILVFEGRSQSYGHSLQVVIETYTGTGYGSDSPWESPVANAFVSAMDLTTFLVLFIVVPYVFRPILESALSPTAPTSVDRTGHIVVCGIEQQSERLIEELEARDVNYVVIVDSEETVIELVEAGVSAIFGDPTSVETHDRACVDTARSVVVDTADSESVSVLLAIRECNESVRTVVLVDDLEYEQHLSYAGADRVLTPRHLLGRRIAERITTEISPGRSDSVTLGEELSILELTVFEESPICGDSIAAIETDTDRGVTVVGVWKDGRFVGAPDPETVIDEHTVLLLAGRESEVRQLELDTYRGRDVDPTVIIAGYGVVGKTVHEGIRGSTADCTVVDREAGEGIDVVGDVTEEKTLKKAGVDDATVLVMTISDDDEAILSVLLADKLATDIDIIARMNHDENETKARRAGADYVLTLPEISGRVLAQEVLQEEILSYNRQLKTVRIDADPFAGRVLGETELFDPDIDCVVVAIERSGELITDVTADFEINEEDQILVMGSDEAIDTLSS